MDHPSEQIRPVQENFPSVRSLPRRIEYTLTREDVCKVFQHRRSQQKEWKVVSNVLLGLFLTGLTLWCWPMQLWEKGARWQDYLGFWNFALLLFLLLMVSPWLFPWLSRRADQQSINRAEQEGWIGPQTATIEPDGVRHSYKAGEQLRKWEFIDRIAVEVDVAMFLDEDRRGVLVPQQAFRTNAEFHAFVELARQYHRRARPQRYIQKPDTESGSQA